MIFCIFELKNALKTALKIKALRSTYGISKVDLRGIPVKLTINPTVMEKEKYRNMTISIKVAAEEKIMLRRLAEKYKVSLSEFMYNLVMCFKNQYDYIGMLSPKEEKLAENLRLEKKKNAKLYVQIENADFRVKMEMNHRVQIQNENHELTYQIKEQKVINAGQAEELKRQIEINQALATENKKLRKKQRDQHLKNAMAGAVGILTGFSITK